MPANRRRIPRGEKIGGLLATPLSSIGTGANISNKGKVKSAPNKAQRSCVAHFSFNFRNKPLAA